MSVQFSLSPLAWQREADRLNMMAHRAAALGGDDIERVVRSLKRQARDAKEMATRGER